MPNDSEHSRLLWLAAVERARTVAARNPAGVLLHIVKNGKWDYLSAGHYEAANSRLKRFLHAAPADSTPFLVPRPAAAPRTPEPSRPELSKDAQLVDVLRRKLGEGGRSSVFAALHHHAGWDRGRYAAAVAELEESRPSDGDAVREKGREPPTIPDVPGPEQLPHGSGRV
jgi:hypothetical protein